MPTLVVTIGILLDQRITERCLTVAQSGTHIE